MYFLWVRVVQFIFLSKQKQVKPQRKCIVKESCNSCSLQGLGANMAEAESSTDQRMLRGGGGWCLRRIPSLLSSWLWPCSLDCFLLINPSWWIMHPVIENFRSVWSLKSWFPHSSGTVQSVIPPPCTQHKLILLFLSFSPPLFPFLHQSVFFLVLLQLHEIGCW